VAIQLPVSKDDMLEGRQATQSSDSLAFVCAKEPVILGGDELVTAVLVEEIYNTNSSVLAC